MNPQKTTLVIMAMLSVSIALADDFTTLNGKEYKNATVSRVEPDGVMIKFSGGIVKIPFTDLSSELKKIPLRSGRSAEICCCGERATQSNQRASGR